MTLAEGAWRALKLFLGLMLFLFLGELLENALDVDHWIAGMMMVAFLAIGYAAGVMDTKKHAPDQTLRAGKERDE